MTIKEHLAENFSKSPVKYFCLTTFTSFFFLVGKYSAFGVAVEEFTVVLMTFLYSELDEGDGTRENLGREPNREESKVEMEVIYDR